MMLQEKERLVGVRVGDKIKITKFSDPFVNDYIGRVGVVNHIDDSLQIHGTWGGLALSRDYGDDFVVLRR